MRNLRNTRHKIFAVEKHELTATALDFDDLIFASGPSEDSPVVTLKRLPANSTSVENAQTIASWDVPSPSPDLKVDRILNIHCFADNRVICLVLEGGDIIIIRQELQLGEELIEIVGSVDVGISAAAWSPDEELLAIATKAETVLFMTKDFEGTANIPLAPEDVQVSNHVSVGWGKEETQFKGRGAAKVLRDPTVPDNVDEGTLSPFDTGGASISWRGDGQYIAVNCVLQAKRRIIRIYSREGRLESVSEPVNGLEQALSWKPSGQTIAGIQRLDDKIQVVFFERNGLRHGEFDLRLGREESETIGSRIQLCWNADSTVLAVLMQNCLQLWTTSNYHWYLKQELQMSPSLEGPLPLIAWHPEKPLHFICYAGHQLHHLSYVSSVCRGSVTPPYDLGLVAVIDGKKLKITPLRIANVPPPMAFDEVELPSPAIDAVFSTDGTAVAVLHAGEVTLWSCDYVVKPFKRLSLQSSHEKPPGSYKLSAFTAFVSSKWDLPPSFRRSDRYRIMYANLDGPGIPNDTLVSQTWSDDDAGRIHFHLSEQGVLHVTSEGSNTLRISGCTSFLVSQDHLIFITSQHLLKFVHLHGGELQIPLDEPEKDGRCRNVERGARLVTVMPSAYSLVLQMPRGNLETIHPRALVLAGIRRSIIDGEYEKAFMTCRTHRVDMNILHDYAPEQFMADVELLVKQVKKTEYIDLVLSSLSEEDVSKTIYKDTLRLPTGPHLSDGHIDAAEGRSVSTPTSKVNKICDAFLGVLKHQACHLRSTITAHVCKMPPDLEAGLSLVSALRKDGKQPELERAVEHICFLADVNQLYDTALGLYDLDVTLLVAQQSQKDPREYLPYLQALQDMPTLRQRFAIDNDLKRFPKALTHLHALDSWDELKGYTVKHELYSAALELYRYDSMRLVELIRLHADFLSANNRHKEAGLAYEYVLDYAAAFEAYKSVGMWRECLTAAAFVPVVGAELESVATDLAVGLEESKNFSAAATVTLDHLHDLPGAVRLLCNGYHFAEAMRLVAIRQQPDLWKAIDHGLVEASASVTELTAEMNSQLGAQVPRLRLLRQKKADDPMGFLDGAEGDGADIPDNISLAPTDASTTGTFMTRYTKQSMGTLATNATRKTSKNRRREERKRARGKKGTVYEEEYLVNSVARLIERLDSLADDVKLLVEGLMRRAMRERAVAVERAMRDVMDACRECMGEVFGPAGNLEGASQEVEVNGHVEARPWGGQGVLWDAMMSTEHKTQAPSLRSFEFLVLTGSR